MNQGESRLVHTSGWVYVDLSNVNLGMAGRLSWKRDAGFFAEEYSSPLELYILTVRSHYDQFFNWRIDEDDQEFVIRFSRKPEAPSGGHINVDMKMEVGLSTQPDGSVLFDGDPGNGEGDKVSKFSLSFEISREEWEQPEEHEIKFFHHPEHKLLLAPENYSNDVHRGRATCDACMELITKGNARWVYECPNKPDCDYGVHVQCAQLARTIRHPSHLKHGLRLLKLAPGCSKRCDVCRGTISRGLHYNCAMCDFDLHQECPDPQRALETQTTSAQMQLMMAQQMAASMANAGQAMCNLAG